MKKVVILLVVIIFFLCIPLKVNVGAGVEEYSSFIYTILRYNSEDDGVNSGKEGVKMTVLGFDVINTVHNKNETKGDIYTLVDKTTEMKDFSCAEALQQFYEDDYYTYSYPCIKSDYIVVKYINGSEETVKDALKNKRSNIEDLDKFNIKYYKNKK